MPVRSLVTPVSRSLFDLLMAIVLLALAIGSSKANRRPDDASADT